MTDSRRVLLKVSGEWFSGDKEKGFDEKTFASLTESLIEAKNQNIQIALVLGGGNIYRGRELVSLNIDQVSADYIGMLSTIMNGIALSNFLTSKNCDNSLFSSFAIGNFIKAYSKEDAEKSLLSNKIVILVGGLGNPLFTTDSTASVRAVELKSDVMLKATNVDGIYSDDPKKNKNAQKFDYITFDEAIQKNLKVMDQTSLCFCRDNNLEVRVFNANSNGALLEALINKKTDLGTLVKVKND